jgi:argininosuccinate synthase
MSGRPTVVVAYSGGLDTSFLVARAAKAGQRVVAVTIDTGGFDDEELRAIELRSKALGAEKHVVIDARQDVFDRYVSYLIKGNVLKGGVYPLSVAAERYAQAEHVAKVARAEGATTVVHGSTGAGNDQVRFDVSFRVLAPELTIHAPVRDEGLTREQEKAWLQENGLLGLLSPSKTGAAPAGTYSVNAGLWGTTSGGGQLHDTWERPEDEAYPNVKSAQDAADLAEELDIEFDQGVPVSAGGPRMDGVNLVLQLNKVGQRAGVGRGIHLGDTVLGLKGRIAFEAPAALILIHAHRELEKLVLTGQQQLVKDQLALTYGDLFHRGLFWEPLMRDLEAFLDSSQRHVTGTARVRLYRGCVEVVGVKSPFGLMDPEAGRYGERNALWDGRDAKGFALLIGVPSTLASRRERRIEKAAASAGDAGETS